MLEVIEETSQYDDDLFSEIFTEIKKNATLKRGEMKELKRIFEVEEMTLSASRMTYGPDDTDSDIQSIEDFVMDDESSRVVSLTMPNTERNSRVTSTSSLVTIPLVSDHKQNVPLTSNKAILHRSLSNGTRTKSNSSSGARSNPPEIPAKAETTITKVRRFRRSRTEYIILTEDQTPPYPAIISPTQNVANMSVSSQPATISSQKSEKSVSLLHSSSSSSSSSSCSSSRKFENDKAVEIKSNNDPAQESPYNEVFDGPSLCIAEPGEKSVKIDIEHVRLISQYDNVADVMDDSVSADFKESDFNFMNKLQSIFACGCQKKSEPSQKPSVFAKVLQRKSQMPPEEVAQQDGEKLGDASLTVINNELTTVTSSYQPDPVIHKTATKFHFPKMGFKRKANRNKSECSEESEIFDEMKYDSLS